MVRTPPFHGGNTGSNPVGNASFAYLPSCRKGFRFRRYCCNEFMFVTSKNTISVMFP